MNPNKSNEKQILEPVAIRLGVTGVSEGMLRTLVAQLDIDDRTTNQVEIAWPNYRGAPVGPVATADVQPRQNGEMPYTEPVVNVQPPNYINSTAQDRLQQTPTLNLPVEQSAQSGEVVDMEAHRMARDARIAADQARTGETLNFGDLDVNHQKAA